MRDSDDTDDPVLQIIYQHELEKRRLRIWAIILLGLLLVALGIWRLIAGI